MNSHSKTANVLGGRTARACDSCLRKRARWFCTADDAFLCQSCDVSVHSANQLASRHERVRIESASWRAKDLKRDGDDDENPPPLWHKGFTKKPRTPRSNKSRRVNKSDDVEGIGRSNRGVLVPEISSEETTMEENDEQLFCRVPVLDNDTFGGEMDDMISNDEFHELKLLLNDHETSGLDIPVFCTTDMALDELSVDVDSLLCTGIEKGSCTIQGMCFKGESCSDNTYFESKRLKIEEENRRVEAVMDCNYDPGLDVGRESFNWDFDYSTSPVMGEEEELGISCGLTMENIEMKEEEKEKRRINLKINYEAIISAWDCKVSPWINGSKPDVNPDDCWPDFLGGGTEMDENSNGTNSGRSGGRDGEREARVLRYREKRRTRLFAKKIRYEVRKLNAEKRPRMKGRFVKRTSFLGSSLIT